MPKLVRFEGTGQFLRTGQHQDAFLRIAQKRHDSADLESLRELVYTYVFLPKTDFQIRNLIELRWYGGYESRKFNYQIIIRYFRCLTVPKGISCGAY